MILLRHYFPSFLMTLKRLRCLCSKDQVSSYPMINAASSFPAKLRLIFAKFKQLSAAWNKRRKKQLYRLTNFTALHFYS